MIVHAGRIRPAATKCTDASRDALVAARHALRRAQQALADAAGLVEYQQGAREALRGEAQAAGNVHDLVDRVLRQLA